MNTRPSIEVDSGPSALTVAFNTDNSTFAVGLDSGIRMYNTERCEVLKTRDLKGGIGISELLENTSILALGGGGKQPKYPQNTVVLWDDRKSMVVNTMRFRSGVQAMKLTRTHVMVVLLNSVTLYKLALPPEKVASYETTNNPFGLGCLGSKVMVFPGMRPGQVRLVDIQSRNVSIIPAAEHALRALALSRDGEVLATASETGTIIRVWSTSNCARIAEFRRGMESATIFSLGISPSNTLLAATSDKATLHIFDLPHATQSDPEPRSSARSRSSSFGSIEVVDDVNEAPQKQGWGGVLAQLPFLSKALKPPHSFSSAKFEIGDEKDFRQMAGHIADRSMLWSIPLPGVPGGTLRKGLIGWATDEVLYVLGAGKHATWEKFAIGFTQDGRRVCFREAWRRYLVL